MAKNFRVGISRKLAQSKMFRNGHSQKWIHAKFILKNLTKILKMDTQWFQSWVSLNGLSVIYLLFLSTKNQRWLFTFGQPLPLLLAEKIVHRSTKKKQLLLLNLEIVQVRNIGKIHRNNECAQNYLDLAICDIKFIWKLIHVSYSLWISILHGRINFSIRYND